MRTACRCHQMKVCVSARRAAAKVPRMSLSQAAIQCTENQSLLHPMLQKQVVLAFAFLLQWRVCFFFPNSLPKENHTNKHPPTHTHTHIHAHSRHTNNVNERAVEWGQRCPSLFGIFLSCCGGGDSFVGGGSIVFTIFIRRLTPKKKDRQFKPRRLRSWIRQDMYTVRVAAAEVSPFHFASADSAVSLILPYQMRESRIPRTETTSLSSV